MSLASLWGAKRWIGTFELGDVIVYGIVIRDIFGIGEDEDIKTGALEVLDRLHVIGEALTGSIVRLRASVVAVAANANWRL